MSGRVSQWILLSEDQLHDSLLRHVLKLRGVDTRSITSKTAPSGEGSGKQYVDKHYPEELQNLRLRTAQSALVVVTDADEQTTHVRLSRLAHAAQKSTRERGDRGPDEHVVVLVPKWHIETWVHRLRGNAVDEMTRYKDVVCRPYTDLRSVAERFISFMENDADELGDPQSLVDARMEYRRLKRATTPRV